jgi:hypothetical protein
VKKSVDAAAALFRIDAAGRMKSMVSEIRSASAVTLGLRRAFQEAERPLVHVLEIGITALANARSRFSVAADCR